MIDVTSRIDLCLIFLNSQKHWKKIVIILKFSSQASTFYLLFSLIANFLLHLFFFFCCAGNFALPPEPQIIKWSYKKVQENAGFFGNFNFLFFSLFFSWLAYSYCSIKNINKWKRLKERHPKRPHHLVMSFFILD